MQVVRVESLEKLEAQGGQMRLSANAGSLRILFSQEVWKDLISNAPAFEELTLEELEELGFLREQLERYAGEAALEAGDDNLRVLSVRGHLCSTSRFEMPPELWQVLSGRLGWRNVETITRGER